MRISRNNTGALKSDMGRLVRFGLFAPGGADLIGFTPVLVRPEHVGKRLAVFTALELKCGATKITAAQQQFINNVQENGGIAAIVRDEITSAELRAMTSLRAELI